MSRPAAYQATKWVRFGQKPVFLPQFTVTLIRPPPNSNPYTARFLVPLDMGKLDLRDYLFHAYAVKTTNIRSFVEQQPITGGPMDDKVPYKRPQAKKYMTVEMSEPFVWPEEPESYDPWGGKNVKDDGKVGVWKGVGKERRKKVAKQQEKEQDQLQKQLSELGKKRLAAQVDRVKRGVEVPRISFSQLGNQDGFKVKV